MPRGRYYAPIEVAAHGISLRLPDDDPGSETEAQGALRRGPAETEAHARIALSFPPDAPEQTLELRYRPGEDGGEPELELHGRLWSDARLKRDIRSL